MPNPCALCNDDGETELVCRDCAGKLQGEVNEALVELGEVIKNLKGFLGDNINA